MVLLVLGDELVERRQLVRAGAPVGPDRELGRRRTVHPARKGARGEHKHSREERRCRCATSHCDLPDVENA